MDGKETCGACGKTVGSGGGMKAFILAELAHIRECPALSAEEREDALGITLALLELLGITRSA